MREKNIVAKRFDDRTQEICYLMDDGAVEKVPLETSLYYFMFFPQSALFDNFSAEKGE